MDDRSVNKSGEIIDESEVKYWYELYMNVKRDSYNLNTFDIPYKLFKNLLFHPNWDIFELKLKSGEHSKPVAVVFCYMSSKKSFSPFMIGLDYRYVISHGCYRQGMFQSILRANRLKCKTIYLGMDASVEKQKFGSRIVKKSVFIQATDNFNMELMEAVFNKRAI